MTAIRPDLPALPARIDPGARPAVRDAQAAFFRAAMGQAAPAAPAVPTPVQTPVQSLFRAVTATPLAMVAQEPRLAASPAPETTSRPGGLLDIRV